MEARVSLPDEVLELIAKRAAELVTKGPAEDAGRWIRGAGEIAAYLACPTSRVYALSSERKLPVERDGSALLAHTRDLDEWVRHGGATRT